MFSHTSDGTEHAPSLSLPRSFLFFSVSSFVILPQKRNDIDLLVNVSIDLTVPPRLHKPRYVCKAHIKVERI